MKDKMDNSRIRHFKNSPIKNKNGECIGVSVIAKDITERKRVENALKEINNCLLGFGSNVIRFHGVIGSIFIVNVS